MAENLAAFISPNGFRSLRVIDVVVAAVVDSEGLLSDANSCW